MSILRSLSVIWTIVVNAALSVEALIKTNFEHFKISLLTIGRSLSKTRPKFESEELYGNLMAKWRRTRHTPESINEHVIVFEQDLCQLVEQLKEFVYLDIYGKIDYEKLEPYHLMVQKRFPNSRIYIQISRFSLWI
ncbi:unnamed protein product [Rotaria magnacalcarata]|uniref:Uncharacterized protein n=3 Tax=Rotaria magnacalcarata TaxID=392030 RepID=A0A816ED08_9BILA|nr:unnamed protein product [Rotaria magnacalcarata]CAF1648317.1 unnamed protein product [Rotaria magnacalcarata]CAF2047233.1 unnamed protein product [Rotaria magnacalcarata]